jgi:hypothetical protein
MIEFRVSKIVGAFLVIIKVKPSGVLVNKIREV